MVRLRPAANAATLREGTVRRGYRRAGGKLVRANYVVVCRDGRRRWILQRNEKAYRARNGLRRKGTSADCGPIRKEGRSRTTRTKAKTAPRARATKTKPKAAPKAATTPRSPLTNCPAAVLAREGTWNWTGPTEAFPPSLSMRNLWPGRTTDPTYTPSLLRDNLAIYAGQAPGISKFHTYLAIMDPVAQNLADDLANYRRQHPNLPPFDTGYITWQGRFEEVPLSPLEFMAFGSRGYVRASATCPNPLFSFGSLVYRRTALADRSDAAWPSITPAKARVELGGPSMVAATKYRGRVYFWYGSLSTGPGWHLLREANGQPWRLTANRRAELLAASNALNMGADVQQMLRSL